MWLGGMVVRALDGVHEKNATGQNATGQNTTNNGICLYFLLMLFQFVTLPYRLTCRNRW